MKTDKKYNGEVSTAIHETVSGLYESGIIDKRMLSEFEASCLTPIREFNAKHIYALQDPNQNSTKLMDPVSHDEH